MTASSSNTDLQNAFAPTKLTLSANVLLCIREFAARKDIRYYLNTIHFCTQGGRAYISATDGHMAAVLRTLEGSVEGPDVNWLVPIELFEKLGKSPLSISFSPPMAQGKVLTGLPDGGVDAAVPTAATDNITSSWRCEVQLHQDAQTRTITSLEAGTRFPDMARLFPKETGGCAAPIDNALLTRIYKAYAALKTGDGLGRKGRGSSSGTSTHPVFGYPTQPDSVVLLDFRDVDFTGLVMPLRGQDKASTADWLSDYGQAHGHRLLDKVDEARQAAIKAGKQLASQQERPVIKRNLDEVGKQRKQTAAAQAKQAITAARQGQSMASTRLAPANSLPARFVVPEALLQAQALGAKR